LRIRKFISRAEVSACLPYKECWTVVNIFVRLGFFRILKWAKLTLENELRSAILHCRFAPKIFDAESNHKEPIMKKYFVLACVISSAALAQSQTQPGQSIPPASQPASPPQPGASQVNPAQPGISTERDTIFNQPAGANRPEPAPILPGSTNSVLPSTTNRIIVNPTSPVITDPSGAANPQIQPGEPGAGTNGTATASEQAFTQRLRAAVTQPGTQQIFSPQNQSLITVINQDGVVTLQGTVKNEGQKRSIEARLKSLGGVTSINNQLQVSDTQQNPDQRRLQTP
jgi:hypothetical protein